MSLLDDFGQAVKTKLFTDASAAIGIVRRSGFGKLMHLKVRHLRLQDQVRMGSGVLDEGDGHRAMPQGDLVWIRRVPVVSDRGVGETNKTDTKRLLNVAVEHRHRILQVGDDFSITLANDVSSGSKDMSLLLYE